MEGRRRDVAAATLGWALLASGCFSGADALHLPCEQDGDCGQGQSCVASVDPNQKFCDGPPDTFGPGTTVGDTTGPGSTGGTTDSTGSDSSGESTGTPVMCGADLDPGKECEPGQQTASGTCTDACRAPILFEAFDSGVPQFRFETLPPLPMALDALDRVPERWEVDEVGDWMQLEQYSPPDQVERIPGGVALAVSDAFMLPPPPDFAHYELRFRHRFQAEPAGSCGAFTGLSDSGSVGVWTEGDPASFFFLDTEVGGQSLPTIPDDDPLGCQSLEIPPGSGMFPYHANALGGEPGFIGQEIGRTADELTDVALQLPPTPGMLRLAFIMSYDCGNCWVTVPDDPGWRVTDVTVAAFRN
jgi:hypothetical protein